MKSLNNLITMRTVWMLFAGMFSIMEAEAQLNPLGAGYFQNQYLLNPAMSGLREELNINLGYRREWHTIPNSPSNQSLTADYGLNNKIGLGLNVYNDEAGVLSTTKGMLTYSYHVALTGESRLHLGISAGAWNRRIDNSSVNGAPDDPLLATGNKTKFDADFGAAYANKNLTVQAAFPNMVTFFGKDENDQVNKTTFFAAASYKILVNKGETIALEPKVAFRGVKGFDNIIDAGANIMFGNYLNVFGLYHTSKNATAGAGLRIKEKVLVTIAYTSAPTAIKTYTEGHLEMGIAFSLAGKNKRVTTE